jgi:ribonuclease HII
MERELHPNIRYIVGVDEAGRGPIAGPVAVGAVALPVESSTAAQFRDSKKLAQHKREFAFAGMQSRQEEGGMRFSVAMVGPQRIDAVGINGSIAVAIERAVRRLGVLEEETLILLDGGLRAPRRYPHQETVIKGDEKVYAIALASIAAKVQRDAKMRRIALDFPEYGFDGHKGYGTHEHYKSIQKHGLCVWHRRSFLKQYVERELVGSGY